ncbi:MAG TPA: META domain-containing protein [Burkholderiales bacterium]|nr:META domain-containing protein [Burkholderiales bacterium]
MKICKPAIALIAAFWGYAGVAAATPLEDCASSSAPTACLDAKLKTANQQLNATLKAAQDRLEQLQAHGRRPVLGTFIDSQRKFNAYRDAQCNWQGIRAAAGANGADYVKDCQIRATLAREQELAEFLAGDDTPVAPPAAVAAPASEPDSRVAINPESPPAADQPAAVETPVPQPEAPAVSSGSSSTGSRGIEWHLVKWVANGAEKPIAVDSTVTIAFDPSGKIAGNASVNRFAGTYRFDIDGRLEWPRAGFSLTRIAGPQPLMAQERAFLESLRRTTQYRVDGQQLVLESQSGATVLMFAR